MREIAGIAELKGLAGQELGCSPWYQVSQDVIEQFAELTHDPQWIHVDEERARRDSPFGATIAHGFLTLSLISYLLRRTIHIAGDFRMNVNYGFNRVRFPAPVLAGSMIRLRLGLESVQDIEGGIEIVWKIQIESEGKPKPNLVADWITRIYF